MERSIGHEELVEHWTLLDDDQALVGGKRGPTRLGFALLLKFYGQHGRIPEAAPRCRIGQRYIRHSGTTATGPKPLGTSPLQQMSQA